jgi:hypothetical protein
VAHATLLAGLFHETCFTTGAEALSALTDEGESENPFERLHTSWRCRLFGHKWRAAHVADVLRGESVWVYTDHVCEWCWRTEYRHPKPPSVI